MQSLYRALYRMMIAAGRPIGGIRPRRLYDWAGRRAYPKEELAWVRNRWGSELLLSHHYHLDRNILIYGDYDHGLHLLFERRVKAGMVALDVGANLGEMALHLAQRVGPSGMVHAFEPLPAASSRLRGHVVRNGLEERIKTWELALGDKTGAAVLHAPRTDADNQGLGSVVNAEIAVQSEALEIRTMTLDDFCDAEGVARIDFIKLDIQGGEWNFLQGAEGTLRRCKPELALEISPVDLAASGRTSRDLVAAVERLGYAVFELQGGHPDRRIGASEIAADYASTNVLCLGT